MTLLADLLSTVFERRVRSDAAARLGDQSLEELARDLIGSSGEMSGLALARAMLDRYAALEDEAKLAFFHFLASALGVDQTAVGAALEALGEGQTKASYRAFMVASEPPRQELIRRLNQVPGATGALVQMRADLLRLGHGDESLMALDLDFRHLFASWFNRGFLVLRPISWETSAQVLEKITAYEAVHAIHSWADLRRRLEPTDRRCFAFFHPAMPSEPLIFVEVALTQGIPGSVQALLAEGRPALPEAEADTAVFYSISNCQAGLAGISFGNSLIKQVASDLSAEVPGLTTFVTLSPIPGLAAWMEEQELEPGDDTRLRQLAAYYLTRAKGRGDTPRDPVARFHLGNGAQVHMLHTGADTSEKGHAQSHCVMVNYLYDLSRVTQNHERFAESGEIAASAEVRALAQEADKTLTQE
ncbi:malonyl-CoA decarboxylase [Vannielia litorea]|uniref:malonyl-CoA decarboxylase n=1 Tax=Vannielia litorea TaxID=1217970 RepID=UPI001C9396F3|nr:malonyl-CoA decarboxylase [Vannielia litorea]MBY6048772.1 malonyl-CoA decarboxylase [Vannielia litorea]MBY6076186.1 malonyl-CoA decarboxylase [Vannielia litorea]